MHMQGRARVGYESGQVNLTGAQVTLPNYVCLSRELADGLSELLGLSYGLLQASSWAVGYWTLVVGCYSGCTCLVKVGRGLFGLFCICWVEWVVLLQMGIRPESTGCVFFTRLFKSPRVFLSLLSQPFNFLLGLNYPLS